MTIEKNRETLIVALVAAIFIFYFGQSIAMIVTGAIHLGIPLLLGCITFVITLVVWNCKSSEEREPLL